MKAQDLRIGNWYLSTKFQVPVICEMGDFYEIYARADGSAEYTVDDIFEPLPLTEEWLLKFGFECWFDGAEQQVYVLHNVIDGTSDFEVTLQNGKAYASIDDNCCCWAKTLYTHQLQNLYFALVSYELTIKS